MVTFAVLEIIVVSWAVLALAHMTLKPIGDRELNSIAQVVVAHAASVDAVVVESARCEISEGAGAVANALAELAESHVAVRQAVDDVARVIRNKALQAVTLEAFLAATGGVAVAVARRTLRAQQLR